MAITGIDKDEVLEFTSKYDDGEPKTIFKIGVLSQKDKLALFKEFQGEDKDLDIVKMQEKSYEVLKRGLKGIKNLYDKKSGKHKDYTEITEDIIDKIPMQVLVEVSQKIIESNFVTGQEAKN